MCVLALWGAMQISEQSGRWTREGWRQNSFLFASIIAIALLLGVLVTIFADERTRSRATTAFLASSVVALFEETIAKVVALAVLMPIVASMGGVAGTQTLTLVIRGIALGQLGRANLLYLLNREFLVALLNGLLLAFIVAAVAAAVFGDPLLGAVIALAMVINLLVAAVSGSLLPSVLNRLNIDPAIAGGVVLTTITDVTGFFAFLGLATWAYA